MPVPPTPQSAICNLINGNQIYPRQFLDCTLNSAKTGNFFRSTVIIITVTTTFKIQTDPEKKLKIIIEPQKGRTDQTDI